VLGPDLAAERRGRGGIIPGISPEFYMQIEWLPGARIENEELIFDPVFEEPDDAQRTWSCARSATCAPRT
jgi:hypothetical protein